jgi:hypothetical protein
LSLYLMFVHLVGGVPGRGAPLPGYNAGGRGYPDVSALAFNYIVAVNNNFTAGGRLWLVVVGYWMLIVCSVQGCG